MPSCNRWAHDLSVVTVRPHDRTFRVVVRSALAVVVHDLVVEEVEVGSGRVSGMTVWCVRMERPFFVDTRRGGHHIFLEPPAQEHRSAS